MKLETPKSITTLSTNIATLTTNVNAILAQINAEELLDVQLDSVWDGAAASFSCTITYIVYNG